jgi:capsular polysaccharide biosynthesis protein
MSHQETKKSSDFEDDFSLLEIVQVFFKNKIIILIASIVFAISFAIYSLSLPDKFESSILLQPLESNYSGSSGSTLGDIASIVGIGSKSKGGANLRTNSALAMLRSRDFFKVLFNNQEFVGDFFFLDSDGNHILKYYDPEIENPLKTSRPNFEDSYKLFHGSHIKITREDTTDFLTLSVTSFSPSLASKWADRLVELINIYFKQEELNSAQARLKFLEAKLAETKSSVLIESLTSLIETEIQTLMLGEVSDEFVFKVLDSAYTPKQKSEPNRTLIVLIGLMLGIFISSILVVVVHYLGREINLSHRKPFIEITNSNAPLL